MGRPARGARPADRGVPSSAGLVRTHESPPGGESRLRPRPGHPPGKRCQGHGRGGAEDPVWPAGSLITLLGILKDARALELSAADPAAIAPIDEFRLQLLTIG